MTKVTKEEVVVLRERLPKAHIAIVNRQSSHKKYYVEENRDTIALLKELRGDTYYDDRPKQNRNRHRGQHNSGRTW